MHSYLHCPILACYVPNCAQLALQYRLIWEDIFYSKPNKIEFIMTSTIHERNFPAAKYAWKPWLLQSYHVDNTTSHSQLHTTPISRVFFLFVFSQFSHMFKATTTSHFLHLMELPKLRITLVSPSCNSENCHNSNINKILDNKNLILLTVWCLSPPPCKHLLKAKRAGLRSIQDDSAVSLKELQFEAIYFQKWTNLFLHCSAIFNRDDKVHWIGN